MLNYDEFKELVIEKLKDYFPEPYRDYEMAVHPVFRTNEVKDGITLQRSGQTISPTIYIQDMYQTYRSGNDLNDVLKHTADFYVEKSKQMDVNMDFLNKLPSDQIYMSLINTAENQELLKSCPHRQFQDLSVVYRVFIGQNETGIMSARIDEGLAEKYKVTEPELYELAYKNTEKLFPSVVRPLNDMLREIMESQDVPDEIIDSTLEDNLLYIVTNNKQISGASAILYEENLHNLAELYGGDLYVIPSSVHEMLVLPADSDMLPDEIANIVQEVNQMAVQPEERLSNQVYRYDSRERKMSIVSHSPEQLHDQKKEQPVKGRTR